MWFERNHERIHKVQRSAFWLRPFVFLQQGFERAFDRFRAAYRNLLGTVLNHRGVFAVVFLSFAAGSWLLLPFLGHDFFPSVDAGIFRLHVRAATGTRIEETAKLVDEVEKAIRKKIPADELQGIIDNIGLPISGINLSYNESGVSGPADGDITVALQENHKPTPEYVRQLRLGLHRQFPRGAGSTGRACRPSGRPT